MIYGVGESRSDNTTKVRNKSRFAKSRTPKNHEIRVFFSRQPPFLFLIPHCAGRITQWAAVAAQCVKPAAHCAVPKSQGWAPERPVVPKGVGGAQGARTVFVTL